MATCRTEWLENDYQTVISLAAAKGAHNMIELFVSKGVSVNNGLVLHCAARFNQYKTIDWLTEMYSIDIDAKTVISGETALHIASRFGNVNAVRTLLHVYKKTSLYLGALLNEQDVYGNTALHHAILGYGSGENMADIRNVVIMLLDAGITPNVINNLEGTALDMINDTTCALYMLILQRSRSYDREMMAQRQEVHNLQKFVESQRKMLEQHERLIQQLLLRLPQHEQESNAGPSEKHKRKRIEKEKDIPAKKKEKLTQIDDVPMENSEPSSVIF
jgi:hypothetical protein